MADAIGVSQQTVARWESGDDIPSKYLKDLAIVLDWRVSDFLVHQPTVAAEQARWEEEDDDPKGDLLYGTARLVFEPRPTFKSLKEPAGMGETTVGKSSVVLEYPISIREHARLVRRLSHRDDQSTWFTFVTLDNRNVFVNRSELELFELFHDDLEQAPNSSHEEVYRALLNPDVRSVVAGELSLDKLPEDFPYSERLVKACIAVTKEWGDSDAIKDRLSGVLIETVSGDRRHVFSESDDELFLELGLLEVEIDSMTQREAPTAKWMVELGTEGYHRSSMYRLGALRLIEAPLLPYQEANRRALEPQQERNEDG